MMSCRCLVPTTAALCAFLTAGMLHAATITVTTLQDGSVPGECSLRDAISSANDNAAHAGCAAGDPGHDDIVFADGVTGTISLTGGQLETLEEASITGPGATDLTIDAQGQSRVFHCTNDESTTTRLAGLTLTGGRTNGDTEPGGAIRCLSALELDDVVITGNSTVGPNSPGGGLATATLTTLTRTIVSRNWTEGEGSYGGGVIVIFGSIVMNDSAISDNWTEGDTSGGGGLVVFWAWFDATLTNSIISDNATFGQNSQAGGMAVGRHATLVNSTVSGNATLGDSDGGTPDGGGISLNGNLTLLHSTVVDNHSSSGVDAINFAMPDTAIFTATNSIIAGDLKGAPGASLCSKAIDGAGSGHNLITDASCGTDALIGGTATAVAELALAPLADNGGTTQTHALLPGSVAIDAAADAACAQPAVDGRDQRGAPRPVDGDSDGQALCDVGAYETADNDTIFADDFE